jgi:serine/threonine-protein kinase
MGQDSGERNLLFGVLALQAGLLDARQFAEACSAWASRKDTPLADLVVQRGLLTAEQRALVDQLLELALHKHAGDAQASLAAVTTRQVKGFLAQVGDATVQRSLAGLSPADLDISFVTVAHQAQGRDRYTLARLHAQGGIGQVWLARDDTLGREVALKELRPEQGTSPEVLARFLEEARITGQLEHPAIVPVYELAPGDGQRPPYYTMRFVKGRTLADAVRAYHAERQAGKADPLALRELLQDFVAVCHAVAYAHSRGVLHRDLKPKNVVLGDFGEVILLDWGLAKVLGGLDADAGAPPVSLPPGGPGDLTVQGQALGTPAYMPPEQAQGRLHLHDQRSDVYGLGAILYEVLTGAAPFAGETTLAVLRRVVHEPPVPPRQRVASVPRALEAVCLKALAKDPAARYPSAKEVAHEVQRWLADEPVAGYREPWPVRLGRWRRRHPAVAAAAAVLLLAAVGAGLWLKHERDARAVEAARREAAVLVELEEVAARQSQAQWAEARMALARAEGRLAGGAPADLAARVRQARADLDMVATLEDIPLKKTQVQGAGSNVAVADQAYEAAFAHYGLPLLAMDPRQASAQLAAAAIRGRLLVALYDWAQSVPPQEPSRQVAILAVAAASDPDPWRQQLRQLLARPDRAALEGLARRPLAQPPATLLLLAKALRRADALPAALDVLRKAQQFYPADFWINHTLGMYLLDTRPPRPEEAVGYLRAALAVRPQSSLAHGNLGYLLGRLGKLAEAEAEYRQVIALQPDNALAYNNLGGNLLNQHRVAEAAEVLRRAAALETANALIHINLGEVLRAQGHYAESLAAYGRAHAMTGKDTPLHAATARWLGDAQRLAALAEKLPAVVRGEVQPADAEERILLAEIGTHGPRRFPGAAARLYLEAFTAQPQRAEDLAAAHRYNAAASAARAGSGQGEDAAQLDARQRERWRRQARDWLRADLAAWARRLEKGQAEDRAQARQALQQWQQDEDLARLRDETALARLPEAERAECRKLWADVAALLQQCGQP